MPRALRAALAVIALAAPGCAQLVGVGDVPEGPDAAAPDVANEAEADVVTSDASPPEGGDATDAGTDSIVAVVDAAKEAAPPVAMFDASMCPPWDPYDLSGCGLCGQEHCCSPVAACQAPDDAGVNEAGRSRCAAFLFCVAGYANSPQAGHMAEVNCQPGYSPSELALADTALSCIRASCPLECAAF